MTVIFFLKRAYIEAIYSSRINGKHFAAIDRYVTIEIAVRAFISFAIHRLVHYCVARSRETELIAMHRYHASFSAIAPISVASKM